MIEIVPLSAGLSSAVREFNALLQPTGVSAFPESPVSRWLPRTGDAGIYEEPFVAVEDGNVRGGYILIRNTAQLGDEIVSLDGLRLPISQAVVNRKYSLLPARLIKDALARQPLLYGTGMGGHDVPVARLMKAIQFELYPVPFYFKILRPVRFLTRSHVMKPLAAKLAAYSGAAWGAVTALDVLKVRNRSLARRARVEVVERFDSWADDLWEENRTRYSWVATRDNRVLNAIYPPSDRRFLRVRVWEGARVAGWAVLLDLHLKDDERFGRVRSGQIVDCFAAPEDAPLVVRGAACFLEERGVDFVRTHQSHPAWGNALRDAGFLLSGSSFFLCGISPALREILQRIDPLRLGVHLNRGDGDGPWYLPRRGTPAGAYPAWSAGVPAAEAMEQTHVLGD